jgi:hypothetical protein
VQTEDVFRRANEEIAGMALLEEHPDLTIEEAALAASCLVALPGASYREAAQTLKAMAETATRRRRERDIA